MFGMISPGTTSKNEDTPPKLEQNSFLNKIHESDIAKALDEEEYEYIMNNKIDDDENDEMLVTMNESASTIKRSIYHK